MNDLEENWNRKRSNIVFLIWQQQSMANLALIFQ